MPSLLTKKNITKYYIQMRGRPRFTRLRKLALLARVSQDAGSRNLVFTF